MQRWGGAYVGTRGWGRLAGPGMLVLLEVGHDGVALEDGAVGGGDGEQDLAAGEGAVELAGEELLLGGGRPGGRRYGEAPLPGNAMQ